MVPSPSPRERVPAPPFAHAAILGGGLVGGSLLLALRARGVADRLSVLDPEASVRDHWAERGVEAVARLPFPEPAPAFVCLAGPPRANLDWLPEIARSLPGAIVSDVTSVQRPTLAAALRLSQGAHPDLRFVGAHPLAGSAASGPQAARADLFVGRTVVLCAVPGTGAPVFGSVERTWRMLGGVPVEMSAEAHDAVVAATSHLPQVVASLLAAYLGERLAPGGPEEAVVASGLVDTTRLAASSAALWQEILVANQDHVRREVAALAQRLGAWADADTSEWLRDLEAGRTARARWSAD